ncbi:MAG: serine/threonine-protein kinase [Thermoanaerobaculia bacterium]|nr:serine/threonine-protein kinase [Thermoanaerobaculia bacterium]
MSQDSAAAASAPKLERVGKYDVLEKIADGGFATLYKGRDPFLKRIVAIKVCSATDAGLRQQFLREAEIAGQLDHPNIVRTFDFGFEQGVPYMVQEYLHGEDLWQKIERKAPLSKRQKLGLIVQIAQGLAYSHGLGVLHLDVKPANVRVLENGQAKILDFGIARLAHGDTDRKVDGLMGTAGYLPPEQVRGEAVDSRADIFAFGALAYELFTYQRPFAGSTIPELLKNVLAGNARPIRELWPQCPPPLAGLIHRSLSKEREERYARFEEVLPELVALLRELPAEEGDGGWAADPALTGVTVETASEVVTGPPSPRPDYAAPGVADDAGAGAAKAAAETAADDGEGEVVAGPRARRRLRWAAAASVTVALSLAGILVVLRGDADPRATAQETVPAPLGVVDEATPGVLLVSALPWGEVVSVRERERGDVDLPASRITPFRLRLAPGAYDVQVTGPEGGEPWVCQAHVAAGATHICHAELAEVSVTRYFKEMGWWR